MKKEQNKTLDEINSSIDVPKDASFFKTLVAYSGPGALVAVGYMDPGNWSTSITGGQNFGYLLLSIILLSSLIAMLLQYMSAKLGIVTQQDLAQAIRDNTSKPLRIILWILAELAIMATEIAEVIGAAIALHLLFDIPILLAVIITILDVFILLLLLKVGFRKIESLVMCLIIVILLVFCYQVALSSPNWKDILEGFIPSTQTISNSQKTNGMTPLTGALGIIGATVMPHNLYLHSSLSQSRKIDRNKTSEIRKAIRFSTWDSNIQLTVAFIVNSLLLVMGVAVFKSGAIQDPSFFGLYEALSNPEIMSTGLLASAAKTGVLSTLFAIALLSSGQNSTITGTMAGQIIMEGYIKLKLPPILRRALTRFIAILPVIICVIITQKESLINQHEAINNLMNNSQVFLAFALPFSIIPLLILTNSRNKLGDFHNKRIIQVLGWISVSVLTILNFLGIPEQVSSILPEKFGHFSIQISILIIIMMALLIIWTIINFYKNKDRKYN